MNSQSQQLSKQHHLPFKLKKQENNHNKKDDSSLILPVRGLSVKKLN